jgi:hypothetical protein
MLDDGLVVLAVWIIGFLCGMLSRARNGTTPDLNINGSIQSAVKLLRAIHDIKTGSLPPNYLEDSGGHPENIRSVIAELLEIERKGKKHG